MKLIENIKQGECKVMGFKTFFQKEVIETDAAFANVKGVKCIIGIKDDNDKY